MSADDWWSVVAAAAASCDGRPPPGHRERANAVVREHGRAALGDRTVAWRRRVPTMHRRSAGGLALVVVQPSGLAGRRPYLPTGPPDRPALARYIA